MSTARFGISLVLMTAMSLTIVHAQPSSIAQNEIEHLLHDIETSGCTFYRNGKWYDGALAAAHLRTKYDYLVARSLVRTAEDFIDKAATKSSLSGQPYKIRCGTTAEVESAQWMREALAHDRGSRRD
jgi:hypothetical protein